MTPPMPGKHAITAADLLPMAEYAKIRRAERRRMLELKQHRRVEVGPFATFYFESFETMRHQIHEMLFIEKGGAAQVPGELAAYNPLVPKGNELVATLMIEIDEPERRQEMLARLGGIEETATLKIAGAVVKATAEKDLDRTTAEGKASSVQFVHFPLSAAEIAAFKTPGSEIILALDHPAYGHMARLPEAVRAELAKDLD
ncbi:MAG TPA: DUF3501 family protein [Alphaproteobacteria bacterium]|nr:DUF3501 family protein [Alphaproteobacteria bacterium]